jgi:steroid delta-isomerase-like uncharacterized protein
MEDLKAKKEREELNKSVIKHYWEGKWNKRSPEILDELQTQDVVYHGTSEIMNGIEEYKQVYKAYLSSFHNSRIVIEELIADGDKVMSRIRLYATHNGELEGIPPTRKEISVSIFTVFRLVDGKIAEEWETMDQLEIMQQLGMELQMKD